MNRILRDNILFWGVFLPLGFLVFAVFWADYVYYRVNYRDKEDLLIRPAEKILGAEDIDEVVGLLAARADKLQELLRQGNIKK